MSTQTIDKMDSNRFSGRIKRYTGVGRTVGGLGVQLAANRLFGRDIDSAQHSVALKNALGDLKGPLMKAAQLLGTIPDIIPKEYAAELRQLQSNAPPMSWPFVRRRMKAELGEDWQARFQTFEREAIAAASLGQVHQATSLDGVALALKLQYPDMQSAVEADLNQLKVAFNLYRAYDKAVDPSKAFDEIAERLREELDYTREAKNLRLYQEVMKNEPNVHIPAVDDNLSSDRLLAMHWVEGENFVTKAKSLTSDEQRNQLALNMFRAWYVPLYTTGVIHGDPHFGNYTVGDDLSVNLLDFGCVRLFPARFVGGVFELYSALAANDDDAAIEAYKTWGFTNLNKDTLAVLNLWARFIYGPVLTPGVRPIAETNNGEYGAKVAQEVHKELRRIGGVTIPREFVFMDRAAVGLGSVFMYLDAKLNWYELFHELVGDMDTAKMRAKQDDLFARFDLPNPNLG